MILKGNGLIDGIIAEPIGGAHRNHDEAIETVKQEIKKQLITLKKLNPEERINQRIEKFSAMGVLHELED